MRKGLTTLMTVAIALVSVQALALAPTIGQIPSPIVGNQQGGTQAQYYTYPDAFDLTTLASDDNTASDQLKWSYEIVTTPKYSINGDAPINSATENVVNPPAAKQIQTTWNGIADADAGNDPNPDAKQNTVTIRNINLFPYGGTASTANDATAQNWATHMQPVTFWCSDGSLATSSTVMFYTDNTYTNNARSGWNRLSNVNVWTKMNEDTMANTWAKGWYEYDPFSGFDNHTTSGTWTDGKGLCLNVTLTGQNWGSMATPIGFVTLVDNMVYRIRLKMNCSQMTPGKTPFWDFILENWNGDGNQGQNFYGVDNYFIDNEGGANAVVNSQQGTEVKMLYAPAAFQTAQWKSTTTGIFAQNAAPPAGNGVDYHKVRDAALRFRILDLDARSDLQNNQKFGSVCLQNVIVETCPFSRRVYEATGTATLPATSQYQAGPGNLKAAHKNPNDPVPGNCMASALLGSTISYTGGILALTPSTSGRDVEIVTVTPATNLDYEVGNWPTIADDWPIPWESDKMYELQVDMSAPDSANAAHPWDVLWLNMESPTNEVIEESYITANHGVATPKAGSVQSYYMYFYSGKQTNSSVSAYHFLRWRIRWGNSTNCDWPNPSDTQNTGQVRIHSIRVNKVRFQ